jgi:hypothetical protein
MVEIIGDSYDPCLQYGGSFIYIDERSLSSGDYATYEGLSSWAYLFAAGLGNVEYSITVRPYFPLVVLYLLAHLSGLPWNMSPRPELLGKPKGPCTSSSLFVNTHSNRHSPTNTTEQLTHLPDLTRSTAPTHQNGTSRPISPPT